MKTLLISISVLLNICIANNSKAQNTVSGLYLTAKDYLTHKLSYKTDEPGNKIYIHNASEGKNIAVLHEGKREKLLKSTIYGYHSDGRDYRFYRNQLFLIADTVGFYTYVHESNTQQGKSTRLITSHYFSLSVDSPILRLTAENIATAFEHSPNYNYLSKGHYKNHLELLAHAGILDGYRLKELCRHVEQEKQAK